MPRLLVATGLALLITVVAPAAAPPAQAKMTLEQYRNYLRMPGGATLVRSYLGGLRDGIVMLQRERREQDGIRPSFCPDGDELLKGKRFEQVLQDGLANPPTGAPWPGDIQMGTLVVRVLQAAFPCRTY